MEKRLFYSWQSDLPNSTNRGFIQEALDEVAKELSAAGAVGLVVDRDTQGLPGCPDIGHAIMTKIESADIVVCDVSNVVPDGAGRPAPNHNVLYELAYAIGKHGHDRVLLVMNTAYGPPEHLPFDLRQKRVVTYELTVGEVKQEARREIKSKLKANIKTILETTAAATAPVTPTPLQRSAGETAIETIEAGSETRNRAAREYMKQLGIALKQLDPHELDGDGEENLLSAIEKTVPIVQEFGKVANAIAATNDRQTAKTVVKGFEHILSLYYHPVGFSGSFSQADFDLFRFVGHELFVTLIAHLIREERWPLIAELLKEKILVPNYPRGSEMLDWVFLSKQVLYLDEVRAKKTRRLSVHADILKERHTNGPLSQDVPWDEFWGADLFLLLASKPDMFRWWPRTSVFIGERSPRYLMEARTASGAAALMEAFGDEDLAALRKRVGEGQQYLIKGKHQMGDLFADDIGVEVEKIGAL